MKKTTFCLVLVILLYSCGSNNCNSVNENSDNISIDNIEMGDFLKKTPNLELPIDLSADEIQKKEGIEIKNKAFKLEIQEAIKKKSGYENTDLRTIFKLPVNNDLFILLVTAMQDWGYDDKIKNAWLVTIKPEGKVINTTYNLFDFSEADPATLTGIKINQNDDKKIQFTQIIENFWGASSDTYNLTKEEDYYLNNNELYFYITPEGKIIDADIFTKKDTEYSGIFEGTIGDKEVLTQFFYDSTNYIVYGKYLYKKKESENLFGRYNMPAMTAITELNTYTSSGDIHHFTSISSLDKIFGDIDNNKNMIVKLKKSDKTWEELRPGSVISKITNKDFKEYISHFAQTNKNFTLNYKQDLEPKYFEQIPDEFVKKYRDDSFLLYQNHNAKFYYGYSYLNSNSVTCICFIDENYKNHMEFSFGVIEYSFEGKIISFNKYDKLPDKITLRAYDLRSDEPKNMFDTPCFNDIMEEIKIYLDIPMRNDDIELIVTTKIFDENNVEKNKKVFSNKFSANSLCLKNHTFTLKGNFGCSDLHFSVLDSKGVSLKKAKIVMECGE